MSEQELVKRAQHGDYKAFAQLVSAHKERIYSLAHRLVGSKEDADDIVQEVFLKAIDKIDQFRLESAFGTWLYSIALNEARALFASRRQADLRPIDEYLPTGHEVSETGQAVHRLFDWHDPHSLLESAELQKMIDDAIQDLPYIYREAFLLRYVEELPVKDVAKMIGESQAATKSRILRARLALRDHLARTFEDSYGKKLPRLHQ